MIDSNERIDSLAGAENLAFRERSDGRYEPEWRVIASERGSGLPKPWRDWLLHHGSLTARLQQRCAGQLTVEVLSQDWRVPVSSEQRHLALEPEQTALVREVVLSGNGDPWVYARSIIPKATFECALKPGHELGDEPLGAWLFSEPSMTRGAIEVAKVTRDYLIAFQPSHYVCQMWARRSVFRVRAKPLLVIEVFLPALNDSFGVSDQ